MQSYGLIFFVDQMKSKIKLNHRIKYMISEYRLFQIKMTRLINICFIIEKNAIG